MPEVNLDDVIDGVYESIQAGEVIDLVGAIKSYTLDVNAELDMPTIDYSFAFEAVKEAFKETLEDLTLEDLGLE